MLCSFASDIRLSGLCDSHGISGEIFFGPRPKIEYVNALGFCWSKLDEPWVLNPPMRRVDKYPTYHNFS
jgi:hypothetical protein